MDGLALKRYLDIAGRRWWLLLLPAIAGGLLAYGYYVKAPKLYRAQTTIQVQPQRIPERLLESTVTIDVQDTINMILPLVHRSDSLKRIADEMGLLPADASEEQRRDLFEKLRSSLEVNVDRQGKYYTLTVTWPVKEEVAGLASAFSERYREENVQIRHEQLSDQVELFHRMVVDAEESMLDKQREYQAFRASRHWSLPQNRDAAFQRIDSNRRQIDTINFEIQGHQQQIRDLRMQRALASSSVPTEEADPDRARLEELKRQREELLTRLAPKHPRVIQLGKEIEGLEARVAAREKARTAQVGAAASSAAEAALDLEIDKLEQTIASKETRKRRLEEENQTFQGYIDASADVAAHESELSQDVERLAKKYEQALASETEVLQTQRLESSGVAQSFRVLEEAETPLGPSWPKLLPLLVIGTLAGLALGVGIIAVLEALDQSFRSEEDLAREFDVPILVAIPNLEMAFRARRTQRKRNESRRFPRAANGTGGEVRR